MPVRLARTIPAVCSSTFRHAGFTLHDALTTLAVIGSLLGVAVPSLHHLIDQHRQTSAANMLVTALMVARSESIKRTVRAVLCPSLDGETCMNGNGMHTEWHHGFLIFADQNADGKRDSTELLLHVFEETRPLRIYSSIHRNHVAYLPDGFATGTNLTFLICGSEPFALRSVIVSNTGRPRIETRQATCPSDGNSPA